MCGGVCVCGWVQCTLMQTILQSAHENTQYTYMRAHTHQDFNDTFVGPEHVKAAFPKSKVVFHLAKPLDSADVEAVKPSKGGDAMDVDEGALTGLEDLGEETTEVASVLPPYKLTFVPPTPKTGGGGGGGGGGASEEEEAEVVHVQPYIAPNP